MWFSRYAPKSALRLENLHRFRYFSVDNFGRKSRVRAKLSEDLPQSVWIPITFEPHPLDAIESPSEAFSRSKETHFFRSRLDFFHIGS